MAMINIPSTCDDPAYRYKMPKLVSKKEGRGNGSKTCIVNMGDVARALKRPPQYTTKWFGLELVAQSTYSNKEGTGERAIVNGHHDTDVFQASLDKFISKYVCCKNCKLPEIDLAVKKDMVVGRCCACGWMGDLDNNHKIAVFIAKNPPDESGNSIKDPSGQQGDALDKKARRQLKLQQKMQENNNNQDSGSEGVDKDDKEDKKKSTQGQEGQER